MVKAVSITHSFAFSLLMRQLAFWHCKNGRIYCITALILTQSYWHLLMICEQAADWVFTFFVLLLIILFLNYKKNRMWFGVKDSAYNYHTSISLSVTDCGQCGEQVLITWLTADWWTWFWKQKRRYYNLLSTTGIIEKSS